MAMAKRKKAERRHSASPGITIPRTRDLRQWGSEEMALLVQPLKVAEHQAAATCDNEKENEKGQNQPPPCEAISKV